MTYLSGRAKKRKSYTQYAIFFAIFLAVVLLWPVVKKYSYTTLEPAVVGYGSAKQSFTVFPEFFSTYLTSHQSLAARQKELEAQVEELENKVAEQDAIIRENISEDTSTSTDSTIKSRHIVMYPLMQDVTKLYSTLVLSKGFKDGITVGEVVYMRGYQAVCTVKEVYTSSSLCVLLTSSGNTIEGVTSSSSITLTLVGRGGSYIANVARDTPVTVGETVYLRSNQKMVLGIVKQVLNNNQDTSWHIFVEGPYNPVTSSVFYVQQ